MAAPATQTQQQNQPPKAAQVELILAQLETLPTLPSVALRLFEVTTSSRTGAAEVSRLIESDPTLSARILSVLRRSNTGSRARTVDRAVVLLGFNAVRNLALSVQIFEHFSKRMEQGNNRFDWTGFWKHSLAVGCAARLLAGQLPPSKRVGILQSDGVETAFLCGLLHDLGKVALNACFPKSYDRVLHRVESIRGSLTDCEREVFGVDHTLVGKRLAMHWKLPTMVTESIWLHHHTPANTPTKINFPQLVQLVQLGDRLVRRMRIGYSGSYVQDGSLEEMAGQLHLKPADLEAVESALPEMIEARAELIGLNRFTSKNVYTEALAEANTELSHLNESLMAANYRLQLRNRCFDALRTMNAGLGDEPTHEEVCRLAIEGMRQVIGDQGIAVLGSSPCRWSVLIAAGTRGGEAETAIDVWPANLLPQVGKKLDDLPRWRSAEELPGALLDHLNDQLGRPAELWWPISYQQQLIGAIVITQEACEDEQGAFTALADNIGLWLHEAENRTLSTQLNEELAEMNRRLVASQAEVARVRSLAMIGDMAAGAAHELNNPLAVISGRAQLLNREDVDENIARTAKVIAEHAHKASAIVEELMEFAKPATPKPTTWSAGTLLAEIRREWLEKSSLKEADFVLQVSDDDPKVHADAAQMRMLFDEIIRNAIESLNARHEPHLLVNCRRDLADDTVVIEFKDNGCGMSQEILEQAMTPFFSHRPAGRGRGLGLSRAARYAQINRGQIRISSELNEGTTVFVELPSA